MNIETLNKANAIAKEIEQDERRINEFEEFKTQTDNIELYKPKQSSRHGFIYLDTCRDEWTAFCDAVISKKQARLSKLKAQLESL
jgi:hypothetical protein